MLHRRQEQQREARERLEKQKGRTVQPKTPPPTIKLKPAPAVAPPAAGTATMRTTPPPPLLPVVPQQNQQRYDDAIRRQQEWLRQLQGR